jgi:predicted transcriptional regulator
MNWPAIVETLRKRGWTQVLLAQKLGVVQSAISDLSTGGTKDPTHSTGSALVALHDSGELPPSAELVEPTKAAA